MSAPNTPKIVNKSFVITKEGKRVYGMDAELYKKMQAKEDPDWEKKVIAWIEGVLGEKLPSDELWVCLKNGLVLIRLLNAIKPGTVVKYNKTRLVPLLEMDNIHIFLKGCWTLGVPSECMFSTTELHKRQDMSKVMRNLEALSKIAPNFGIKVEPLDSSKKALPKKVELVESSKEKEDECDPVQMVTDLRDEVRAKKSQFEQLENEEKELKAEITKFKRAWRDEKTQLIYAVSNAEKRLRKAEEQADKPAQLMKKQNVASSTSKKKTSILPTKSLKNASERQLLDLQNFAKTQQRQAQETLSQEQKAIEETRTRTENLKEEERALLREINELEKTVDTLEGEVRALEREVISLEKEEKAEEVEDLKKENKVSNYTNLDGKQEYYFYETNITSKEMVDYLTVQMEKLLMDKNVSFEDLFKLKQLFETDEGRRVFCFVLFSSIRAKKRANGEKFLLLNGDSFDYVLWLFNTVLQSMSNSNSEGKVDFFSLRVLMKYSSFIVRELHDGSLSSSASSITKSPLRSPRKNLEAVQKFIRSDPLWRTLSFWQELFLGDLNKKFRKKFSHSSSFRNNDNNVISANAAFNNREKKFIIKFLEDFLNIMGTRWRLKRSFQEKLAFSVSENLGLTDQEMEKVLRGIVDESKDNADNSVPLKKNSSTTKGQLIQKLSLKQKREVFGAPLRPRKGELNAIFKGEHAAVLNPDEAEQILPSCIWEIICVMESDDKYLKCVGIFRQSGGVENTQLLRAQLEAGEAIDYNKTDPHDLAAVFKLFIRELPEPLATWEAFKIVQAAAELSGDQKKAFVMRLLRKIPDSNRIVLKKILGLLYKYSMYSEYNKMTANNLAVIFSPALFREKKASLMTSEESKKFISIVEYLINEWQTIN